MVVHLIRYIGLASFGLSAFYLGSNQGDIKAAIGLLGGFATILGSDAKQFTDAGRKKSDRRLFNLFLEDLPSSGSIQFLKQHDWFGKFHDSATDQLDNYIRKWSDPEFEFLDTALEFRKQKLNRLIIEFFKVVGHETFPWPRNPEYQEIPPEWQHRFPDRWKSACSELERLSNEICETHRDLVVTGRHILGIEDPSS